MNQSALFRFLHYSNYAIRSNLKKITLNSTVIATFYFAYLIISRSQPDSWPSFLWKLSFVVGSISAILAISSPWHHKEKAALELGFPISALERFFSFLIISGPILMILVTFQYFVISNLFSALHTLFAHSAFIFVVPNVDSFSLNYILFHSIAMCGSLFFKRSAIAKTGIAVVGYVTFNFLILLALGVANYTKIIDQIGLSTNFAAEGTLYPTFATLLLSLGLYAATYFRIKELEVL